MTFRTETQQTQRELPPSAPPSPSDPPSPVPFALSLLVMGELFALSPPMALPLLSLAVSAGSFISIKRTISFSFIKKKIPSSSHVHLIRFVLFCSFSEKDVPNPCLKFLSSLLSRIHAHLTLTDTMPPRLLLLGHETFTLPGMNQAPKVLAWATN